MTYVKSYILSTIGGNNRLYRKEVILLKCDNCGKQYSCDERYKSRAKVSNLHFCCKGCSSQSFTDGKLKKVTNDSIIMKYDGYYVTTKQFKEEQKDLCLSLYGVPSRLEASEILSKIEETNIAKYGKPTFAGSDQHVKSLDYKAISVKAWKTKIQNGSCSKSLPEEVMYEYLVDYYGFDNVQRQKRLFNQWIDFYIPITNVYIQVDGVYWHGLNRPVEIIKLQKTSQDKKIYKQILRDEKLNDYCMSNNIKLIRLTDKDLNTKTKEEIYAML